MNDTSGSTNCIRRKSQTAKTRRMNDYELLTEKRYDSEN